MRTAASAPRNRAARSIHIHHAYKVYRLQGSTCRHPARFGIKRQRYKCLLSKMVACSVPCPYGRPRLSEPGQSNSRIGSPSHCAATDQLAVEHPPACNGALFPASVRAAQNPRLHCRKDTVQFPVLNTESCPSGRRSTIGNRVGAKSVSRVQIPDSPPVAFSWRAVHPMRRGGRVVECGGLENRLPGVPGYEGSNPSSSASFLFQNQITHCPNPSFRLTRPWVIMGRVRFDSSWRWTQIRVHDESKRTRPKMTQNDPIKSDVR